MTWPAASKILTGQESPYEESISLLRDVGATRELASVLANLGHTSLHLGDVKRACQLFLEGMEIHQSQQNRPGMTECLLAFASLAAVNEMYGRAARLLAAFDEIGGEQVTAPWPATRLEYDRCLALIRKKLTDSGFEEEQAAGRALSLEQAVSDGKNLAQKAMVTPKNDLALDELTLREREVATLIGRAMSNAEIADELVISKRTVESHISSIRSKLGFTKRTQIVQWAFENGLVGSGG